ncbi:hypothetical protein NQ314_019430 [Rhamnusium bicolor]|uniref:RanBD1 domain-containing protein n=1 Tax=Rhamnusium bicolor TaxID=1586634 RepID=A0AAV8WNF6_9CUCU|nr:hypothetical protein NQ314_019430 [Rhamnusium bicolor]
MAPSNKTFILKPSQLNPFATKSSENSDKANSEKTDSSDKKVNQVNGETPKFVPLIVLENKAKVTAPVTSNQSSTTAPSTTVSNNSFIFGQNLQERVIAVETKIEEPKASTSLSSNGTSEMLFSSVIKNEVKADSTTKEKEAKSLSESAREYEESRANKRKYEEVEVITGEEHENNILKISCKLFSFDKATGSWQERGRGTLRLNDFEIDDAHIGSRLVFRTTGSLRIWAEMTIDKASDKSIRLTALDANGDSNIHYNRLEDTNAKHFKDLIDSLNITCKQPTRIFTNKNGIMFISTIDYMITNVSPDQYECLIVDPNLSDHSKRQVHSDIFINKSTEDRVKIYSKSNKERSVAFKGSHIAHLDLELMAVQEQRQLDEEETRVKLLGIKRKSENLMKEMELQKKIFEKSEADSENKSVYSGSLYGSEKHFKKWILRNV